MPTPLKELSDTTLISIWEDSEEDGIWDRVCRTIHTLDFEATPDAVRRQLNKALRHSGWLRPGERPTPKTYQRIRGRLKASRKQKVHKDWRRDDIV